MGLFGGIGKVFKGIGRGIGGAFKSLAPILTTVGLTYLTGGAFAAMGPMLGKFGASLAGGANGLLNMFSGVAGKFLGPVSNLVSQSGLGTIGNFMAKATSSRQLLGMAGSLGDAASKVAQPAVRAMEDGARYNVQQMMAYHHARMIQKMMGS